MIKNILLVGAGGALGSIMRYLISTLFAHFAICSEWAIFSVNVIGSFLIGMLMPLLGNTSSLFLIAGFCGGFTTFSTFSSQALHLFQSGQRITAFIYILASVVISVISVFLGLYFAEKFLK